MERPQRDCHFNHDVRHLRRRFAPEQLLSHLRLSSTNGSCLEDIRERLQSKQTKVKRPFLAQLARQHR